MHTASNSTLLVRIYLCNLVVSYLKGKIRFTICVMKMDKGLKEVYDGIKNLITITEKIVEHTKDIAEIKDKVGAIEGRLDSVDTGLISLKVGQKEMDTDIRVI